jgi:hypothetical protein
MMPGYDSRLEIRQAIGYALVHGKTMASFQESSSLKEKSSGYGQAGA